MAPDSKVPTLAASYQERIRPCIDLVDSLRRIGLDKDVDLPAVVVIGDQSVGKSSVLEAISGVQLPRGNEIVTRCPIELRLKTLDNDEWCGKILYINYSKEQVNKYIDSPDELGAAIRTAQQDITNSQKGISKTSITVEIQSAHVPNLTLIDLPGIARVPQEGQSRNIADETKDLIKKYISKDDAIVLCVIPCNVDIATTEAIKMAQEVDPTGSRTLGVLTKPDLVDKGSENVVVRIAENKVINLKKGYTIMKCRSQRNLEDAMSLEEAMDEEERFFREHKHYSVLSGQAGSRLLAHRLTTELVEQILKSVPQIQHAIKDKLEDTKQELTTLGEEVPMNDVQRIDLLVRLLDRFPDDFKNAAEGVYKNATYDRSMRLQTIVMKLYDTFADELESLQPCDEHLPEIKEELVEQRGLELPPFVKDRIICENLIRQILKQFIPPAERLLQAVNMEVERIGQRLVRDTYSQFPRLQATVMSKFCDLQTKAVANSKKAIEDKFKMEDMIHTRDRIYKDTEKRMLRHTQDVTEPVATTRLMDDIPLMITFYLLQELGNDIKVEMAKFLIERNIDEFLREDAAVEERRLSLEAKRERLDRASRELAMFSTI
ncbi:interferon-induced GTP-binding protein Mx1-like [Saccoglossus kowalevskii]|uniref:Interferon-induced GTP-binding protein Mx-like n=1 Tax=Saccoglossus kowalevskii TaxID=10224 RepID=A0ABM0M4X1_SACKO|nr:PREDICTED: interferon-induced GTP-binding protein Mx-like [Saccoglossus kowalevskii]